MTTPSAAVDPGALAPTGDAPVPFAGRKDEAVGGLATVISNYLRRPGARKRINAMRLTFQNYSRLMGSVAVVARKPVVAGAASAAPALAESAGSS